MQMEPDTAMLAVVAAGLGKEAYDRLDYGLFDKLDLFFTILGGVVAWAWIPQ